MKGGKGKGPNKNVMHLDFIAFNQINQDKLGNKITELNTAKLY